MNIVIKISSILIVLASYSPFLSCDAFTVPIEKPILFRSSATSRVISSSSSPAWTEEKSSPYQHYNKHNRKNGLCILHMGWGPEPIWSNGKVILSKIECRSESCVTVKVEVSSETKEDYKIPGQYVQLRLNEDTKPIFLAISSPPSSSADENEDSAFEFLIKKTDTNDWITDASVDTPVEISQVLGNGFAIKDNIEGFKYDFPTQQILLFATGSGIAPIKAAIESGQLNIGKLGNGGRSARLYYGVRSPNDLCYIPFFRKWENSGIQVVLVLSDPPNNWEGRTGYVQTALEEDGVPIPRNCGVLMCGQKGMTEAVKDVCMKAGIFEGRTLTNF